MKNIAQHIEELIIKHNCVIVPQLGGFLTYQTSAYIYNNKLYAPTHQIRFNKQLSHQDGLLAEAYMRERKVNYTDAVKIINEEIYTITKIIENGDNYILGRIGSISLNADKQIIFKASNASFLPENIGLTSVSLIKRTRERDEKIVIKLPTTKNNFIRYAAAVAIIILSTLLMPSHINDSAYHATLSFDSLNNIESLQKTDINKLSIDSIYNSEDTKEENLDITENKDSMKNEKIKIIDTKQIISNNKYHLIVASLTSLEQANKYIEEQKNYDTTQLQIIEKDGKYRISAMSFKSYKIAINYIDSIKGNGSTSKNAWILRN